MSSVSSDAYTRTTVAAAIEATALGPDTSTDDVRHLCAAALVHGVRGVCVPRQHVGVALSEVAGSGLEVVTVAGFPTGDDVTAAKVAQIDEAAAAGAHEVDVVIPYRRLGVSDEDGVREELETVVAAAHERQLAVKLIVETGALDPDRVVRAAELAVAAGADWVKTSTGFGPRGATAEDVVRLRDTVGGRARVKAAGGIRTWDDAVTLLEAGADALGCSRFVAVLDGAPRR